MESVEVSNLTNEAEQLIARIKLCSGIEWFELDSVRERLTAIHSRLSELEHLIRRRRFTVVS